MDSSIFELHFVTLREISINRSYTRTSPIKVSDFVRGNSSGVAASERNSRSAVEAREQEQRKVTAGGGWEKREVFAEERKVGKEFGAVGGRGTPGFNQDQSRKLYLSPPSRCPSSHPHDLLWCTSRSAFYYTRAAQNNAVITRTMSAWLSRVVSEVRPWETAFRGETLKFAK